MKKYQYVIAAACVLVGAIGFSSMYLTNQAEQRKAELAKQQQLVQESQQLEIGSKEKTNENENELEENIQQVADAQLESKVEGQEILENEVVDDPLADVDLESQRELESQQVENQQIVEKEPEKTDDNQETAVTTIVEEKLSFQPKNNVVWPIEGSVLLDYSMESTIFFPTLQQYQHNPAMIISGTVNDKVYFVAKGKITNIETNEVTGCTVTQDLGDGYTAIYGQLKELNFEVGEMVESGQVVGYVSEPTKYYSVEGSNVYFQVLKNGVPIDPEEILP